MSLPAVKVLCGSDGYQTLTVSMVLEDQSCICVHKSPGLAIGEECTAIQIRSLDVTACCQGPLWFRWLSKL